MSGGPELAAPSAATAPGGVAVLSIRDLVVDFPLGQRTVRAVDGLSLPVLAGHRIGIVGESGSGKSTVALAVLGLLEAPGRITGGEIMLGDTDLVSASEDELRAVRGGRISMVFQDALGSLNPVKTIGYQLTEAVRLHTEATKAQAVERAVELLTEVGVQMPRRRLEQYPHEFSGGMRQRVMIAMALASDPELLIADEPTTALDVTTQASVIDLLRRLAEERRMAVLLITHDLGIVAGFAQDVLVMYAGAPVEYGTVDDVFRRPAHPYTQALLASVPRLGDRRSATLASIPGSLPRADAIPPGCRFAPRCRLADGDRCATERPAFDIDDPAARVACHHVRRSLETLSVVFDARAELGRPAVGDELLVVSDLVKDYRARGGSRKRRLRAVDGVSFDIRRGESVGLVGESGSGKSTVARLLLGLTERTRGAVTFEGRPLEAGKGIAASQRGRVQMVFQDPGDSLNPLMSVEQIVAEPLRLLHRRDWRRMAGRVPELLELVGLDQDFGKRRSLQLSGGQRQRVAIARALATDPALIVCDEAVSSLDVSVRAQILNLLMDLQRRLGLSYLFISHDLSTVRHVCDRVAVMYGGRFVEVADADAVFSAPTHPYTIALLSAVPEPDPEAERARRHLRLAGELPDLTAKVEGCIFASRCWKVEDRCRTESPALAERGTSALTACHFPENTGVAGSAA